MTKNIINFKEGVPRNNSVIAVLNEERDRTPICIF